MEQQHELRNGIVSALESSVSTTDALESDRAPYIVYRRPDWLHLSHSLHNYIGIFQSVPGNGANDPASFRNFFE
jgi:hypothetical protein